MDTGSACGDTRRQRNSRDCSRPAGCSRWLTGRHTDRGQFSALCQCVQIRCGAGHLVSTWTCRAFVGRVVRDRDDHRWWPGTAAVMATTRETTPRHSGGDRTRGPWGAAPFDLAEVHFVERGLTDRSHPPNDEERREKRCRPYWLPEQAEASAWRSPNT